MHPDRIAPRIQMLYRREGRGGKNIVGNRNGRGLRMTTVVVGNIIIIYCTSCTYVWCVCIIEYRLWKYSSAARSRSTDET